MVGSDKGALAPSPLAQVVCHQAGPAGPWPSLMVGERGPAALVLGCYAWPALHRWEHWGRRVPGMGPGSLLWTSLGWEVSWPLEGPRRGPH